MQIETIGQYQLHLIAHESGPSQWDPFVTVMKFDAAVQDFVCVLEKHHAGPPCASYEAAIETARRAGAEFMRSGMNPASVGGKTD